MTWINSLKEQHNLAIADMLDKLLAERYCDINLAVVWSVNANNTLTNTYGFSPYQMANWYKS